MRRHITIAIYGRISLFRSSTATQLFFYLAFLLKHSTFGCPIGGCLPVLRSQLVTVQLSLAVTGFVEQLITRLKVAWSLRSAMKQHQSTTGGVEEEGEMHHVEEQAMYINYHTRQQVETMTEIMISFGFVLIFGAVCPIMVPICFVNFAVTLRGYSHALTSYLRRTVPRKMQGIGAWKSVVKDFTTVGMISSAILVVNYGAFFHETGTLTQLSGILLLILFSYVLWHVVDLICPKTRADTHLIAERRSHVVGKIRKICGQVNFMDHQASELGGDASLDPHWMPCATKSEIMQAIGDGSFHLIPRVRDRGTKYTPRGIAVQTPRKDALPARSNTSAAQVGEGDASLQSSSKTAV